MKDNDKKSDVKNFFSPVVESLRKNCVVIVPVLLTFLCVSAIIFFDSNTTDTVASFAVEEYEIGQIADKTIYASKTLEADDNYPVSVEKGEKVIRKGFPITEEEYFKLKKLSDSPVYVDYRAFCNKVLFMLLTAAFWILLFNPILLRKKRELKESVLESILFVLVFFAAAFGDKYAVFQSPFSLSVLIPSSFCAFLVAILFGQISALFFSVVLSMGVLCASSFQLVTALFTLASGVSAARIVLRIDRRIDLVFASIMQAVLNVVFIVFLKVVFNGTFGDSILVIPGIAFNGFLSGILVLGFLTPLETLLNTASVFRLMDLSDQNAPILRSLLLNASGTYQHSMMVAQLAENACRKIGANALLARVGGYYHDIGKLENPEYFTENNIETENKHADLEPSRSASIIRSHVKKGYEKGLQLHLPKQILDIISEHHGNGVISFFYNKAKEKDPNVDPADFSYPGNPPATKESGVVMLADVCEAACKSLDNPTPQSLENRITQLINAKIEEKQLDNCALTFGELTKIRNSFVDILAAYYHRRIKYQNQKEAGEQIPSGQKEEKGE